MGRQGTEVELVEPILPAKDSDARHGARSRYQPIGRLAVYLQWEARISGKRMPAGRDMEIFH